MELNLDISAKKTTMLLICPYDLMVCFCVNGAETLRERPNPKLPGCNRHSGSQMAIAESRGYCVLPETLRRMLVPFPLAWW